MGELERIAAPDALVVHVWGSAGEDPREALVAQKGSMLGRAVRDVVLGYVRDAGVSRWLTHAEISSGVLDALDTADKTDSSDGSNRGTDSPELRTMSGQDTC